ncbi:hypothetical protein D9757_012989 [Collybiopsis confluens]|uniref:Uncharacterized protein n=1 Tax=Collybiopsis confluens TaxID=2823264 RepID=A0A8H5LQ53_9AGAR|nr:hypothetical protein D9757_012989 [Collybiopsis confluens]
MVVLDSSKLTFAPPGRVSGYISVSSVSPDPANLPAMIGSKEPSCIQASLVEGGQIQFLR